jgi:integrase
LIASAAGERLGVVAGRTGSVIVYEGARGRVFRIRYRDVAGARVLETLGAEADGWTLGRAADVLRERLVDVKRDRRRKVAPVTLAEFARDWLPTYASTKSLKKSTHSSYHTIIERHVAPSKIGKTVLSTIDVDDVERYVAAKLRAGLAPGSVNRHLNLLSLVFNAARKRQLVRSSPIPDVDRPREPRRRWAILTPAEISRVDRAFVELAAAAPIESAKVEETRAWIVQARVVFLVVVSCGLRRGEVLGLHWRSVTLAIAAALRVEETWVRAQRDTPKSEAGERTIPLDPFTADELFRHRGYTAFAGDDERVFCHPTRGTPLDPNLYAATLKLALKRAKVERPMRPFHDGRHTAITNDAVSGNSPVSIQARAGHASFSTTQRYIDLAGVEFREEADRLGQHLFGDRTGG